MRNVIILGSGRSGTSMTAGVLAKAGYFMGENLNPGNETNPKGQFEDQEINWINEELLSQVTPARPSNFIGKLFFKSRPVFGQRWLARVPPGTSISATPYIEKRIKALTEHEPFCFKDPRLSYTLSAWRPFLKNTVFVCVFRHPGATVTSILKQSKKVSHLRNFSININRAFQVWQLMYTHVLRTHYPQGGDWLFLNYDQFFNGEALNRLEKKIGIAVNHHFVDQKLNRSTPVNKIPPLILRLYEELCNLADYREKKVKY